MTKREEQWQLRGYKPTRFKAADSVYKLRFADAAVFFINNLIHSRGEWHNKPFLLLDWQERIVRDIFGIVHKRTHRRQFRTAYIEVPKKNGKSEIAAAIALLLLCGDNEPKAEIYSCATARDQAAIVFDAALEMVRCNPVLEKYIKYSAFHKSLEFKPTGGIYKALPADAHTKHGVSPSGIIFDELHAQTNPDYFKTMTKGSGASRRQPLTFIITTAGYDRNSVGFEQHQKAMDILEGKRIDPTFYPCVYSAPEDADWSDEKMWREVNPSLGRTFSIDFLRHEYEEATFSPADENGFRQLHLNQWVKQSVRWMNMGKWDDCAFPFNVKNLKGRVCYAGLDLSSTTDITALVLCFPPEDETDKYIILPHFWIPDANLHARVKRDHVPYDNWAAQGLLTTTDGEVIHYGYIEKYIEDLAKLYNIKEIAYDPWGAFHFAQILSDSGYPMVEYRQGYKTMSPAMKTLMQLTLEKRIAHGGNVALRWMVDNMNASRDPAGNIKPDKESATEKIDGAVAMIMAVDRAFQNNAKRHKSVYETRGIIGYSANGWVQ